jgi:hypothetical protein
MVEEILDKEEHSEKETMEIAGPTHLEVENSVLRASINIRYHEQQGLGDE